MASGNASGAVRSNSSTSSLPFGVHSFPTQKGWCVFCVSRHCLPSIASELRRAFRHFTNSDVRSSGFSRSRVRSRHCLPRRSASGEGGPFGVHCFPDGVPRWRNRARSKCLHCLSAFTAFPTILTFGAIASKGIDRLHCLSAFTAFPTVVKRWQEKYHKALSSLPFGVHCFPDKKRTEKLL